MAKNLTAKATVVSSIKKGEHTPTGALLNICIWLPHFKKIYKGIYEACIYKMWIERILSWLGYVRIEREGVYKSRHDTL